MTTAAAEPAWAVHDDAVRPEWLDGNRHMNLAFYVLVFDRGTDAWLAMAGLGPEYRRTGGSVFAVEAHTLYLKEVREGAALRVRTALARWEGKRIHLMHEMSSGTDVVARHEVLFLHMDMVTRRPAPLGPDAARRVAALAPPAGWTAPAWLGRHLGQERTAPGSLQGA